jgi:Domain of unknown function (DUF4160)
MGTITVDGVRFHAHSGDHHPPHVHAKIGAGQVILELIPGDVAVLDSSNVTRSELRKVIATARAARPQLEILWKKAHAK